MKVDWISDRANLTPDKTAVVLPETREFYDFDEMNRRAVNIASYLKMTGVKFGDRIVSIAPNDISLLDLYFACTKIGAVLVPINWKASAQEIDYMIKEVEPTFIFYDDIIEEKIPQDLPKVMVKGNFYKKLVEDSQRKYFSKEDISPDSLAVIMYTSGSTGFPKGVMMSHRMVILNILYTLVNLHLGPDEITIASSPMYHIIGLFGLVLPLLANGGSVIIDAHFKAEKFIEYSRDFRPTVLFMVPTMYFDIAQEGSLTRSIFSDVHTFVSGGSKISEQMYKKFKEEHLTLINCYGLTEIGSANFMMHGKDTLKRLNAIGKPNLFTDIKIIDDQGNEVPTGKGGELVVRGEHLFSGYWRDPEATSQAFSSEYFHTNDLGVIDEEGYYHLIGRKSDMIISGGENIMPVEIERILEKHLAVEEVVVFSIPHRKWGEAVISAVTTCDTVTEDELKCYVRKYLTNYKTPKAFIFYESFPRAGTGKIDKIKIREEIQAMNLFENIYSKE